MSMMIFIFGGWPVNSNKDDIVGANLTPDCEKSQKEIFV